MLKILDKASFGPKLRFLRRKAKINQTKLARAIGVETATVSRWESSLILPTQDHFEKICDFFDKTEDFFLDDRTEEIAKKHDRAAEDGIRLLESIHGASEAGDLEGDAKSEALLEFMAERGRLIVENVELKKELRSLRSSAASAAKLLQLEKGRALLGILSTLNDLKIGRYLALIQNDIAAEAAGARGDSLSKPSDKPAKPGKPARGAG